ncbi:Protein kinase-like domain [Phytophthora cactorum]|nr:Protein kinase-like domain [Phytophthora cactorum]
MTGSMDHPHIVRLIGVAWDFPANLCFVMEYMEGGDLQTLLSGTRQRTTLLESTERKLQSLFTSAMLYVSPHTFDSRHPSDVKSRNILLNHEMKAKFNHEMEAKLNGLWNFDRTLRRNLDCWSGDVIVDGTGSNAGSKIRRKGRYVLIWCGVVRIRRAQTTRDAHGRLRPDAYLLPRIVSGELRVEFSQQSPPSITKLGELCASVDPELRPAAHEAHCTLQLALVREYTYPASTKGKDALPDCPTAEFGGKVESRDTRKNMEENNMTIEVLIRWKLY